MKQSITVIIEVRARSLIPFSTVVPELKRRLQRRCVATVVRSFGSPSLSVDSRALNPTKFLQLQFPKAFPHLPKDRILSRRSCYTKQRISSSHCTTAVRSHHPNHPSLGSTLALYPAAVTAIVAFTLISCIVVALNVTTTQPGDPPDASSSVVAMSLDAAAPGHVGNLTPEQEEKLRQLWSAIFKVCGVTETSASDETPTMPLPRAETEFSQKKKHGIFRWKSENPESTTETRPADDNDRYGQTKQFQNTLASQTPESIRQALWSMVKHDNPDALVLRFLRARKWDVDKAIVMLISALSWRNSQMKVDSDIMMNGEGGAALDERNGAADAKKLASDFMTQCRTGMSFLHGTDKEGRPICIIKVRLHKPGAQSAESLERYTVFVIETARMALKAPVDTATVVFDMTGFTLANMDYHPVKFMIQCFEANYPESLGAVLVHNSPWVFQGIWRIIRGWLDPVVAAKVHFTNNRAGLEKFIAANQIIKDLGGDEDWEFTYVEPREGENDAMMDTNTRDRLLKGRAELYKEFEAATQKWIQAPDSQEGKEAAAERPKLAEKLRVDYWTLDPYVRSRSLYDRIGNILPGGGVNWYNKDKNATATS
ncbi:CRAL/TRIO domain protein [Drechmeria coniospora]|uniref:CRAL/TRIO domain protein n=1 Tax=Drechmeria coniospora TaxID=98403 RepID=A0A151GHU7_DRECN|nr:CRAL/TRIO domain protein [Drechmeria coniospora]KYK56674.1 CRAL/TRIO domain protein [Drechmeria coniospora]ODA77113.1 hypothetical protein RJ55_07631 [Drechmeria coniospora]